MDLHPTNLMLNKIKLMVNNLTWFAAGPHPSPQWSQGTCWTGVWAENKKTCASLGFGRYEVLTASFAAQRKPSAC
jgi:hypothetical protein